MPHHFLTNFELQRYENKPRFYGIYSRNNLPKIQDEVCVINLDEYKSIGTHWIALHVNGDNVTYFNSFGGENIPKVKGKGFFDYTNLFSPTKYEKNDKIILKHFQ